MNTAIKYLDEDKHWTASIYGIQSASSIDHSCKNSHLKAFYVQMKKESDYIILVYAIQHCGGQLTADGKRFRTGGGVLWNVLKKHEPNAYKEIMTKGKEFEKQFKQKSRQVPKGNTEATAQGGHPSDGPTDQVSCVSQLEPEEHELVQNDCAAGRVPIHGRLRAPVSYDDLFGDGI